MAQLQSELIECRCSEISTIPCCVCGGEVIEFTVPNDIWNFVMRPDGHETDKEYLCLDCWYKALRDRMFENEQQLATVTAERDAAVEDLRVRCSEDCDLCIHNTYRNADCPNDYVGRCDCWEWRGERSE